MSNGELYRAENDKYILRVFHDEDAPHPIRDNGNFGHVVAWVRGYHIGDDVQNYDSLHNFLMSRLTEGMSDDEWDEADEMDESQLWGLVKPHVGVVLFLRFNGYFGVLRGSREFDENADGVAYATLEEVALEYGDTGEPAMDMAYKLLESEVEEYSQYLQGHCYGYKLFKRVQVKKIYPDGHEVLDQEEEEVDSCWGFIGEDYFRDDIRGYLPDDAAELVDKL